VLLGQGATGERDDGGRDRQAARSGPPQREPAASGNLHVEQDEVEILAGDRRARLAQVLGVGQHRVADARLGGGASPDGVHQRTVEILVLHQQDAQRMRRSTHAARSGIAVGYARQERPKLGHVSAVLRSTVSALP